jgi:serine/threonine protein kinase
MSAERVGDYELVRYLTAGGMADLYLARSPKHPGDLVVKRIQPRFVEYTRVVKMFIDEGRIAQALEHPNIVKIVDVGQEQGNYFIAMEYIAGKDLLAICRRGVEVGHFLPRPLAVALLAQALRGLSHAHEKRGADGQPLKVVHCDISPGNIVVSWGGTAKIVDFGISRATIQLRTEDHSVAGKYNYMAPEQIRGEPVDARADLFAMGTILYELTVGKRLFRGRPEQVMRLVIEEPIATPGSVCPDFPPALEAIIMRALDREPGRRWDSARQMREALMSWLGDQHQPCGKREVAEYLRSVFGAEKLHESEEFGAEDDEQELVLEKGLPRSLSGLHVLPLGCDAEDPEDPPPAPERATDPPPAESTATWVHAAPVVGPLLTFEDTAPFSIEPPAVEPASTPAFADAEVTRKTEGLLPRLPAEEVTRMTPKPPPKAWPAVLAGALVALAFLLYFLLHR